MISESSFRYSSVEENINYKVDSRYRVFMSYLKVGNVHETINVVLGKLLVNRIECRVARVE